MSTIEELLDSAPKRTIIVGLVRDNPAMFNQLVQPLHGAGFHHFTLAAVGDHSFYLKPDGPGTVLFRITEDDDKRPVSPFFLQTPYRSSVQINGKPLYLEAILAGAPAPNITSVMNLVQQINHTAAKVMTKQILMATALALAGDAISLTFTDRTGQSKTLPIISDVSVVQKLSDRLSFDNNRCRPDYITLQEQAGLYNAARDADPRFQALMPEPVKFPETELISPPPPLPARTTTAAAR